LKVLTRDQNSLIQGQTQLVNQLTTCLKGYYRVALELFSKLHQPPTLAFLRAYPTAHEARSASLEAIVMVPKPAGHTRVTIAAITIYQTLQQEQPTVDAITTYTKGLWYHDDWYRLDTRRSP
jgi:hypothetical protein